jgi:predicted kinase
MLRIPRANVFRHNPPSGPGAGRLAPARVVSPDHHLIDPTTGLYRWTPARARAAWGQATAELHEALAAGGVSHVVLMVGIPAAGKTSWLHQNAKPGGVYFDATFKDAYARRPIIAVVLQYGVPVEAVVLLTPLDEALRRNATRTPDRRVPDEVLQRMHADLTGGGMPTKEEGLSKITVLSPQQASDQMLENPTRRRR